MIIAGIVATVAVALVAVTTVSVTVEDPGVANATIVALASSVMTPLLAFLVRDVKVDVRDLTLHINSRMDQLLEETRASGRAEGVAAERAEQEKPGAGSG